MKLRVLLAALLLASVPLYAQTFRGGIQGSVTDETGAAMPGVSVTATNTGTALARTAISDASGNYFLSELPLGDYSVSAGLTGFKTTTVKGVKVEASTSQRVNLVLGAGALTESVEVTATIPLVDTTHNTQGGTIDGEQASQLPVNGRDFTKLLTLVPGSQSDASGIYDSPGSFGVFSINGNRGRANNYLLDGTDMNDGYRNDPAINEAGVFGTPATILPVDAVAEFPIISGAEAEYGRNAGAIVNIVTKSGTNDLHGSVFEYFRDDALGARNYFNKKPQPKNNFRNNQFGASLGGPLVKDKTFFFLAYEGQRENGGLPTPARVPTGDELNAAIAANGGVVNPIVQAILARNPWPAPNQAIDASGNNLVATTNFTNHVDSFIGKIDQHFAESDLLSARYFFGKSDQSFPLGIVGGGVLPGYNTVTPTKVHLVSVSGTHVISPKLLVELRGGYNRFFETFFPEDQSFNPASVGLDTVTNPRDFGLPFVSVSGFAPIGSNASLPRGRTDVNYQGFANVSYNTGRHNWKFGVDYRRTTIDQFFDAGYRGKLSFDSLDSFIAGIPSGGRTARGDSNRNTAQNSWGFYTQDSVQAGRNVTFNFGLRWDYYGVISEGQNRFSIFDATGAGSVKPVTQLYPKDWNNFSPRVSVAWDTKGDAKTVLRAGYGLYYDAFSADFFLGQLPFNTFNPGPAYNDIQFSFSPASQLVPGQPAYTDFAASDVFTVDQKLKTPYVQTYSANIQQQIGKHAALQIGYVGSQGRSLFRYRDINQPDPAVGVYPFPDFLYINQFESTAVSHYNSLQTSLKIQDWKGLTATINYTLGKSTDTASDGQDFVPNAAQPDDSRHPEKELAPSNFDVRHRVAAYFTWNIGPRKGSFLTSGWAVDGIFSFSSGQPFNVNENFYDDHNGTGEFFGRPDLVGDPFAGTSAPDQFLNLSAFKAPCDPDGAGGCSGNKHIGSLGRNAFFGPKYTNLDLSLTKNTPVGGRATLQIRLDVFNVLNHANFTNPLLPNFIVDYIVNGLDPATNRGQGFLPLTATPDVGGGNPFLGGGGPRGMQLAARITF
jgi:outer membrane receptor protein involved in Fe transport